MVGLITISLIVGDRSIQLVAAASLRFTFGCALVIRDPNGAPLGCYFTTGMLVRGSLCLWGSAVGSLEQCSAGLGMVRAFRTVQ